MRFTQPPTRSPFEDGLASQEWIDWTNQVYRIANTVIQSGTTAQRPANLFVGQAYFDTSLGTNGKPIWVDKNGTGWVDATGTAV